MCKFFLLLFSSSLLCMESSIELSKSIGKFEVKKIDDLPVDIIANILDNNVDLAKTSKVCRFFYEVTRSMFKERWMKLRAQKDAEYIYILINSSKLYFITEPSYMDFKDLYNSLAMLVGKAPLKRTLSKKISDLLCMRGSISMPVAKPEGVDITNVELLLKMDRDVQDLMRIWPYLQTFIFASAEYCGINLLEIASDARVVQVSRWLTDSRNLLAINNAFICACSSGHVDMVKSLLTAGVELNFFDNVSGCTPLMSAVQSGHSEIVRLLLEKGADINITDDSGSSALMKASFVPTLLLVNGDLVIALCENLDAVKILLDAGVDINATNNFGKTALAIFADYGIVNINIIKELLLKNPNVIPEDNERWCSEVRQLFCQARQERVKLVASGV